MKIVSPIPKRRSRIVIIPLIDIMFFLLASFMMISLQMSRTENIKVNLPSATQVAAGFQARHGQHRRGQIGRRLAGEKTISLPDLDLVLSNRFRANTESAGLHQRRPDTLHGDMVNVYQAVRACGHPKSRVHDRQAKADPTP